MKYKIPTEENMEEMKPDTEVKEETSVPEEGAAEAYRICASNDHCAIR